MRDVIWTLIIIWVVYKIVDIFRGVSQKKSYAHGQEQSNQNSQNINTSFPKKDVRTAMQKGAENEGEYVDFEDIK
jgi:hypothetical protein